MSEEDREAEVARKVVAIMQTIAEDTEDRRKRAWRKMLGLNGSSSSNPRTKEGTGPED
jgi:hypothetical protein